MEQIPAKLYSLLNDYIRVGKRLLKQKSLVFKKEKEYLNLRNKIYQKFAKHKVGSFEFEIPNEFNTGNIFLHWHPKQRRNSWSWNLSIIDQKTFESIFNDPILDISDRTNYGNDKEEINLYMETNKDLRDMINEIKKDVAIDFFAYRFIEENYHKLYNVFTRKKRGQDRRYLQIMKIWNDEHPLKVGQEVLYYGSDGYKKRGTVINVVPDLGADIKSQGGRKIFRQNDLFTWSGNFNETKLRGLLLQLTVSVPNCWKEGKIDFYG